mmetsp:Transcript_18894/g.52934  ORF Transcript_18894/g.52934 Transcript_18894/m.52934 type:complete len:225 (-) Transcript_18894:675-1349(-)
MGHSSIWRPRAHPQRAQRLAQQWQGSQGGPEVAHEASQHRRQGGQVQGHGDLTATRVCTQNRRHAALVVRQRVHHLGHIVIRLHIHQGPRLSPGQSYLLTQPPDGVRIHLCVAERAGACVPNAVPQLGEDVDEVGGADDAVDAGYRGIPHRGRGNTLFMERVEGLPHWQVRIQDHHLPALRYQLVSRVAMQEVCNLFPGVIGLFRVVDHDRWHHSSLSTGHVHI